MQQSLIALVAWAVIIVVVASHMPMSVPARLVELIGTLLTLFPVGLDLLRKFYVLRNAPAHETDAEGASSWAMQRVYEAFLGYKSLYAWAVFAGVSLIALSFAIDLVRPGMRVRTVGDHSITVKVVAV